MQLTRIYFGVYFREAFRRKRVSQSGGLGGAHSIGRDRSLEAKSGRLS